MMIIKEYSGIRVHFIDCKTDVTDVIYCLEFPSGKKYIGKTNNKLYNRISQHCRGSIIESWNCYNDLKSKAIRKYQEFTVSILYQGDNLDEKEIELIKEHETFGKGYNLTLGGEGSIGAKRSEETCKKLSELAKKRTGALNSNYGNKLTEEQRNNISNALKGKCPREKNPNAKKIIVFDLFNNTSKIYNCCKDAQDELNVGNPNLSRVLNGKGKSFNGGRYSAKFYESYINESEISAAQKKVTVASSEASY